MAAAGAAASGCAAACKAELGARARCRAVAKGKATRRRDLGARPPRRARARSPDRSTAWSSRATVEPWLEALLDAPWERRAALALAVGAAGALTGDRERDLDEGLRERLAERIAGEPDGRRFARWLREVVAIGVQDQALVLAESLPVGLRLVTTPA